MNDRLAFHNMTNKKKQAYFNQPVPTYKSKLNTQMDQYHMERQNKNQYEYNNYFNALTNNICEDQNKTTYNNRRLLNNLEQQKQTQTNQRIYHPCLLTANPANRNNFTEFDRQGICTRNQRENHITINHNSAIRTNLDKQFQTLTNLDLDKQINHLQSTNTYGQFPQNHNIIFNPQQTSKLGFVRPITSNLKNH